MFDSVILQMIHKWWQWVAPGLLFLVNSIATYHIIMNKRDTRAAIGWLGLTWFSPGIGAILYFMFGINRIRRKARGKFEDAWGSPNPKHSNRDHVESIGNEIQSTVDHLKPLRHLVNELTELPLVGNNFVKPYKTGEESYSSMIDAINQAEHSVTLCVYIFDRDRAGERFVKALKRARERGVQVRVLVDDIGAKYSFPTILRRLQSENIPSDRFMKSLLPWHAQYYNLRNHRKILVVDGEIGFTGGMNITQENLIDDDQKIPTRDLHFKLIGPIVTQLQKSFVEDWAFCTNEYLSGDPWFREPLREGDVLARGVADGPDEEDDRIRYTMLGAIVNAQSSIRIVTPYFLPDSELSTALRLASMAGISTEVVIPEHCELHMVQWASNAHLEELHNSGVKIYRTPTPFDHSKLMMVDNCWSFLGSANWDPRSLKLNFEFNVECYSPSLANQLNEHFEAKKQHGKRLTREELNKRNLVTRFRDNSFRLLSPYL
ncbi:MAG: cardiolipin synthase [bacterium]